MTRPKPMIGMDWRQRAQTLVLASAKTQVLVAAIGAVLLGYLAQRRLVHEQDLRSGLIIWAIALGLFAYGLWRARALSSADQAFAATSVRERVLPGRMELALATAVVGVGIFFRFYRLGSIPPGLNHDAAWEALYSIKITQGIAYAPYASTAGRYGHETMFHYIVAPFQIIMGPTKLALEVASVSIAVATLGAMYLFVRRLLDARVALVATLLLGISGWHLTLSKVGWREILVPLFIPLIFYFLVKAVEERRIRDFAIAGFMLGLSLDTYDSARILPMTAGAFIVYEIVRNRRLLTKDYLHLVAFGACAFIAFSPLGWYAIHHWAEFTSRGKSVWIGAQIREQGSLEPLFINLKAAFLLFNFRANGDDFFTRDPLLDLPLAVFFPLGLVIAITRIRQRAYFLLILILVFDLIVGVTSRPNGNRNLGSVIPVVTLAAVFLVEAWRWLRAAFPRLDRRFDFVLVAVLIYASWISFDTYLGPDHRDQWGFYPETTRVGDYMHDVPDGAAIHAAAGNWPRDSLTYLSYRGQGDPFTPRYDYTSDAADLLRTKVDEGQETVFIVENAQSGPAVVDRLAKRYPTATVDNIYYPSNKLVATAITVPPGAKAVTDSTPFIPPGGIERDATRRANLLQIVAALQQYRTEHGTYPETGGNAQTACAYQDLDKLCQFSDQLGSDTLKDPRNDTAKYGYWYSSDGMSFTLYASLEGPVKDEDSCAPPGDLGRAANLYCVHVKG